MITVYAQENGKLTRSEHRDGMALPASARWIDVDTCTADEVTRLEQLLHIKLPPVREVRLIEQQRQYYADRKALYITLPIVVSSQSSNPVTGALVVVVTPQFLITLRQSESRAIANYAEHLSKHAPQLATSSTAFVGLVEAIVGRLADLGENVSYQMEQVSRIAFLDSLQRAKTPGGGKADSWSKVLQGLGSTARLNHRALDALAGLDRMLAFLQQQGGSYLDAESLKRLSQLQTDINHLTSQSQSMVNEATFMLDAIVGAISIEQNNVIKIFSMVSVILMPPTMVASIYGMNFTHMPELALPWAYPAALVLMLISAILPWWWFKRNGWF